MTDEVPKKQQNGNFGRRSSDRRILHSAKRLIAIEKVFNNEVDALLDAIGLTREEVIQSERG